VRISTDFTNAFVKSPADAERVTVDLLNADRPGKDRLADSGELLHFVSASGNLQQRRTLIAGFRKAGADLALVHHMALLPREQTAEFMKDYLDDGGSLETVMQWIAIAGGIERGTGDVETSPARLKAQSTSLRAGTIRGTPRARNAKMGGFFLFDWAGDVVDDAKKLGKSIVNAADSLIDSVVKAGKSIAQAIGEAANWTIAQLSDLVEGLIRAGKKVADILAAAATKGLDQLKKFVEAVLAAGRSIGEGLIWAADQALATVNAVVAKLLQLGRTVLQILKAMATAGRVALTAIVRALLAAGKRLADLLAALAAETAATVKAVVDALLAAGQALRSILIEAARLAAAACRGIVDALLDLGRTLTELLREAAAVAGDTLRVILQALLALGKTLTQVLVAAADLAMTLMNAIVQALLAMSKSLAEIVLAVVGEAMAVMKAVFAALIAAGRKLVDILGALADRAVSALRTALEALLAMGATLVDVVKDIVTGVAQAFRRGFFEGLVALGKAPLQLLKAAAETSAAVLLLAFAVVLEMCGGYRKLEDDEVKEARKVFGNAIDLDRVKLGFATLPGDVLRYVNVELPRAFTTMYLLNFGPGAKVKMQTIIHELAHVWQGVQQGPIYMTRALEAQVEAGLDSLFHRGKYDDIAAYRVTEKDLAANGGDLSKFNPEQQASIIELYWVKKFSDQATPAGQFKGIVEDWMPASATVEELVPYVQNINPVARAGAMNVGKPAKATRVRHASRRSAAGAAAYA